MRKLKMMLTKLMVGAMTVTTLLATSAGAAAATTTTTGPAAPTVEPTTITLKQPAKPAIQLTTIKLHRHVTTKQISSQVQTAVNASALNLDRQQHTNQLS